MPFLSDCMIRFILTLPFIHICAHAVMQFPVAPILLQSPTFPAFCFMLEQTLIYAGRLGSGLMYSLDSKAQLIGHRVCPLYWQCHSNDPIICNYILCHEWTTC